MAQVNMPEKKDSMAQGLQLFQAAKSIYDMKNGNPATPDATKTEVAGATVKTDASKNDAWTRRAARTA